MVAPLLGKKDLTINYNDRVWSPDERKRINPDAADASRFFGADDFERKPLLRDKLLGWPAWGNVQDSWPECTLCSVPMVHVLQLESSGIVLHQWGDLGAAHVFVCAKHSHEVDFMWAGG